MSKVLVVTGCILFKGQGVSQDLVVEIDKFQYVDENTIDQFGEEYIDNGGDSYAIVTDSLKFHEDTNHITKLNEFMKN